MEDGTDLVSPFSGLMRYGKAVDSHDLLKVVATFFMLIDHLGAYILPDDQFLRVLGRVAAPLFFFLIGYAAHHQFKLTIFLCGVLLSALTFFCEKMTSFKEITRLLSDLWMSYLKILILISSIFLIFSLYFQLLRGLSTTFRRPETSSFWPARVCGREGEILLKSVTHTIP